MIWFDRKVDQFSGVIFVNQQKQGTKLIFSQNVRN